MPKSGDKNVYLCSDRIVEAGQEFLTNVVKVKVSDLCILKFNFIEWYNNTSLMFI